MKQETETETEQEIKQDLKNYYGTENHFKMAFSNCVYTDGIKALIERCKCYWLISDLGIEINNNKKLQKPFLLLSIKVKDNKATITLKEDSNLKPIYIKKYSYTDFPLSEYEFYICDGVFLLKSEY